jgi:hypothetical protein
MDGHLTRIATADLPAPLVRFRVRDIQLPPADELIEHLFRDLVVEGQVVGRSRGVGGSEVVVVQVREGALLVIVSTDHLLAPDAAEHHETTGVKHG